MGKMQHPAMVLRSRPEWAAHFAQILDKVEINQVFVNEALPMPEDGGKHGGITHVPYLTIRCRGQGQMKIRMAGKQQQIQLSSGTAVLHLPGTFARTQHLSPGFFLRFTCDTDHVLCGIARCLDPNKLDEPSGFPPMDACILPQAISEPGPILLSLVASTQSDDHRSRVAWIQAWLWQLHRDLLDSSSAGPAPQWLAMRNWLELHSAENVSRSDCATAFGIHPNHVARLFKQHGNKSFTESLLQLRLKKAMLILQQTSISIQQLATQCGFQDSAYFIRRFREHYGLSPARWRSQQLHQEINKGL